MVDYPDRSFGSKHSLGHNRISYDLPAFSPFDVMMGNTDDCKVLLQWSMPYTKPTTAMNVGNTSNSADDWADNEANDNDAVYEDGMPNTTDILDAEVLEIIT